MLAPTSSPYLETAFVCLGRFRGFIGRTNSLIPSTGNIPARREVLFTADGQPILVAGSGTLGMHSLRVFEIGLTRLSCSGWDQVRD